jgi:hypothetical protein
MSKATPISTADEAIDAAVAALWMLAAEHATEFFGVRKQRATLEAIRRVLALRERIERVRA